MSAPSPPTVLEPSCGDGVHVLHLPDGRRITWCAYGPVDGFPVLALHGTPGSRLKFSATGEAAGRLGLRVIAPDRWGYGGTDAHACPTLVGFGEDMARFADGLGVTRFAVMGVSGGGPYAAALAAVLADRVVASALVSPVGPIAGETTVGISAFHRFCFGRLAQSPGAVRAVFGGFRALLNASPRLGLAVAMARVPPTDRAVLATEGVADRLARTFVEGLRPGPLGPAIDLALFGRRWEVPLERAMAPAQVWIGTEDRNVPISAAVRLAGRLPRGSLKVLPGKGHLWVALHYGDVLAWIAEQAKGAEHPAPSR